MEKLIIVRGYYAQYPQRTRLIKNENNADKVWLSEESLKKIINELTLTGYRGNPEGYINAEHLKERLFGVDEE